MSTLFGMVGNPVSPSGAPHIMLDSKQLNFVGRLKNFFANAIDVLIIKHLTAYYAKQVY